jgi:hypothetical protein
MMGILNTIGTPKFKTISNPTATSTPGDGYKYFTYASSTIDTTTPNYNTSLFRVKGTITADILIIGGGGGGYYQNSAQIYRYGNTAGGAGGQVILNSNVICVQGSYTLTIPNISRQTASNQINPYSATTCVGPTRFSTLTAYSGYGGINGTPAYPTSGWTRTAGWHNQNSSVYKGGRWVAWQNVSYLNNYLFFGGGASQNANGQDAFINGQTSTDTSGLYISDPNYAPDGTTLAHTPTGGAGGAGTTVWGVTYGVGGSTPMTFGSALKSANGATYGSGGNGGWVSNGSMNGDPGYGASGAVIIRVPLKYI